MPSATIERVEINTSPAINRQMEDRLRENVSRYLDADRETIDRRLEELDKEWNVERFIETEAPLMIGLGVALGAMHDRRWFAVPVLAAGMVILHNLQGWYPLLPLFRRLGVRSQNEIEQERSALRILRGDHEAYRSQAQSPQAQQSQQSQNQPQQGTLH
ncbi:hypothetical protein GCM10027343_01820 [Noviherbaspirillum agri]